MKMSYLDLTENEKTILIKMGFKIEVNSKNKIIGLYIPGYKHYIKIEKVFSPPPLSCSSTEIDVKILNHQDITIEQYQFNSQILKKKHINKIKNIILRLHKLELESIIAEFYK